MSYPHPPPITHNQLSQILRRNKCGGDTRGGEKKKENGRWCVGKKSKKHWGKSLSDKAAHLNNCRPLSKPNIMEKHLTKKNWGANERLKGQHYRVLEYIIDQGTAVSDLSDKSQLQQYSITSGTFKSKYSENACKNFGGIVLKIEGATLHLLEHASRDVNCKASNVYLHQLDTCSCHLQHMQANCVLDSIPHCSWQPGMESGGLFALCEHLTVSTQNKISNIAFVLFFFFS